MRLPPVAQRGLDLRSLSPKRVHPADAAIGSRVGSVLLAVLLLHQSIILLHVLPYGLFDFRIFRSAGSAVLAGHSPWSIGGFIYPAPAALIFVPFGALPYSLAAALFSVVAIGALVAALWVLDVRDWRCYAAMFVSVPAGTSITTGTISGVVALLAALVWRYRDHRYAAGSTLALALVLKVFLWPLGLWLIATRRARSAIAAAAAAIVFLGTAWLVIGVSSLSSYREAMSEANKLARASYSPYAFFTALGASDRLSLLLVAAAGLLVLAGCWRIRDEALSFGLALIAALLMSPVVWIHYLVLLYVPIAIARPRMGALWFLPTIYLFLSTKPHADGSLLRIGIVLGATAVGFWLIERAWTSRTIAT
jgi:alpha-1,2-mannosyltransferase